MSSIDAIFKELDERYIAQQVGIPHDEARLSYVLSGNTVSDFREFEWVIGDYYNHHFTRCVSRGGRLTPSEATGRAKEVLEAEYRRGGGELTTAYNDAHDGTNGGLRAILDILADQLKAEAVERHIRQVFDLYVEPTSWEEKVEIIRQFFARRGQDLSSDVRVDQPERYARDWQELVRAYVDALRRTSSVLRRL
jgi:hypothetical protein